MAHVVAPLRHPKTYPADGPLSASDLADHKLAAGAVPDGYVLMANDAAANDLDWSNDGKALINAPLRAVLIADSAAISNVGSVWTAFNKTLTLLAGSANIQGARIRLAASGKYSSKAFPNGIMFFGFRMAAFLANYTYCMAAANQVNEGWSMWAEWVVRSTGTAASIQPHGGAAGVYGGEDSAGNTGHRVMGTAAQIVPFTLNLTVNQTMDAAVQFSVADPANTITMTAMSLDVALPGVVVS